MAMRPERLTELYQEVAQERLSLRSGSPTDAQLGAEKLADLAVDYIPELIDEVRRLSILSVLPKSPAPAATSVSGGAGELGEWQQEGSLFYTLVDKPRDKRTWPGKVNGLMVRLESFADNWPSDGAFEKRLLAFLNTAALAASPASVTSPQSLSDSIQRVLEKWVEVRPGELDEDAVPLFLDELKLAGLQIAPVLQPVEQAAPALATFVQQAYAYKSTFPSLPEGYTHEDIDRLYEWANGADDLLRTAPQVQAAAASPLGVAEPSGWVPVGERLPAPGQPVLLTVREVSAIPGPDYKESFWVTRGQRDAPTTGGAWLWRDGADGRPSYQAHQITHWQPLPSPASHAQ